MASGVEAKYDTLATRMDRLEAKLDFLISAMSLKYVPATVSKTPEKVGKGKGLSAGPSAPQDTQSYAFPGWATVTKKQGKGNEKKKASAAKSPLTIRAEDWPTRVIQKEDLKPGAEGICEVPDEEMPDLWRMLAQTSNILGLISKTKFEEGCTKSREFDCQYQTPEGRVVHKKMWLTNFGKSEVLPKHLSADTLVFSISNNTIKVLLHLVKAHCGTKWSDALKNPGASFRDWMKSIGVQDHVVHSYRPVLRERKGGEDVLEQIVLLSGKGIKTAYAASGQNGMFTKAFVGGQDQLDEFRIVWLGKEVDLKAALGKSALLGAKNRGLAHGQSGLGVRVERCNDEECGAKLLGDAFKPNKVGSAFFEVSKVPVWVTPDGAIVCMETICAWRCEYIRTLRSYGEYKSFLVRAESAPPQDSFFVGTELVLIQPAKEIVTPERYSLLFHRETRY